MYFDGSRNKNRLRASNSIIPKCVVDILKVKYELIVKDVLQLDGSTVKTMVILRNIEMTIHACLSCTIFQDISIVDVKPHFSIFLPRDVTT